MSEHLQSSMQSLYDLIKAKVPYIWVVTPEERRFIRAFELEVTAPQQRELFVWSAIHGVCKATPLMETGKVEHAGFEDSENPLKALQQIGEYKLNRETNTGVVFILMDFQTCMGQPVPRMLRDMYEQFATSRKTLIFLSSQIQHGPGGTKPGLDPTLEKQITVVDYELPNRQDIAAKLSDILTRLQSKKTAKPIKCEYTQQELDTFTSALQGLTDQEITNAISTCLVSKGRLDEKHLLLEKKQVIKRSEILEYIQAAPTMADIGGLDEAKRYCEMYKDQFSEAARKFGIEPLRGMVLTGVPGTGKSLLAKAIASAWGLPLLRLDVGKVMTGLVGGSEEKMRSVIMQAEAVAPCVTGNTQISIGTRQNIEIEKVYDMQSSYLPAQIQTVGEDGEIHQSLMYGILRRPLGDKKLLKITTESGKSITVTNNHKLLVREATGKLVWREAQDLQEGDNLVEYQ